MAFETRALRQDDRTDWQELWRAYLTFYETELPDKIYDLTWRRLLTTGEDPSGCCAVDETGKLIGIVHYIFHRSCWTEGPYCYLQDLFVSADARGGGIGRALIDAVTEAAAAQNAPQVYWLTQHFNAPARALYDQVATETPFIKYLKSL